MQSEISIRVPLDSTSCQLFLTENGTRRRTGLFPLPPGGDDVFFDRPNLVAFFGGYGATALTMRLSQLPLIEDEPAKITVETQDGVDVTKDGEFEVDPPGVITIDENGNCTELQPGQDVQIRFRLRIPQYDLAVGCEAGPCVSLFDSTQLDKGPVNQFIPFDADTPGIKAVSGDFDGDGVNEVGCFSDNKLRLFDVDGTLISDSTFRGGELVAAGDVDGDRRADIVTLNKEDGVATYLKFNFSETGPGVREEEWEVDDSRSLLDMDVVPGGIAVSSPLRLLTFEVGGLLRDALEIGGVTRFSTSFSDDALLFNTLSVVSVPNSTLTVELTDVNENGGDFVIADAVRIEPILEPTSVVRVDGENPTYLVTGTGSNEILQIDPTGVFARHNAVPNLGLVGLNMEKAERPLRPMVLETSTTVDIVESNTNPIFDSFFIQWANLISQESPNLGDLYDDSYDYNGQDVNDITSFDPGFDISLGLPAVELLGQQGSVPEISTVGVDVTRTVTESTLNIIQNAATRFEIRLEHQTAGSDPAFLIQTQREVRNSITATSGATPPTVPTAPVLQSFEFLQTDTSPLTTLPLGGQILVRVQVSGLFPVSGNPTEFGSVRFRLAGSSFNLTDQGGGLFSSIVTLPSLPAGLYAPTVVVENRRLAAPADFLNTGSASVSESRELQGS
ncbi:MAG: VCBS repeat-containing protein [Candidatus Eremiobacteraeota bacterium]|nr:VCBS repeat-containing protein [Candidatus Eremiobacteraeota bacterium]